jgi:hypothetical protein
VIRIKLQDAISAIRYRHGWVGYRRSEQLSKPFLFRVTESGLIAKEENLVLQQCDANSLNNASRKVRAQLHPLNLGAEAPSDPSYFY